MRAIEIVRALCPRAHPNYVAAFAQGDAQLAAAGITTPLRLAHFMAQVFHETGGLTVLVESLYYTTHAALKKAWKSRYPGTAAFLKNERGLGIFVYGGRMGNRPAPASDGYDRRGRGVLQMTGLDAYRRYSERCGVDFVGNPDLAASAEHTLKPALAEWTDGDCNELADRNAIKQITLRINGGLNGFPDRVEWFDKVWALIGSGQSWRVAEPDPDIRILQTNLVEAGYELKIDGRKGPATEKAIRAFQAAAGIPVDGVAGDVTRTALAAKLNSAMSERSAKPDSASPLLVDNPVGKGVGSGVVGGAAFETLNQVQPLLDQAQSLQFAAPGISVLKYIAVAAMVLSLALVAYGVLRPILWPPKGAPS